MPRRDLQLLGVHPTFSRAVQPTPRHGTRRLGVVTLAATGCTRLEHLLEDKQHFKFGVVADLAILQTTMASSSSIAKMLDEHCFRTMFNQNLFEELVWRKKVTPEVTFDLEDDEYPAIKEQIALRGWRRLASPRTKISKLLIQEFYANAVQSDEEMEQAEQYHYKSYVRGVEVDF
ncbi:hypothetical protein PIB30_081866 [Stylosanthes scabra]|uniref:Uncharacterized protein n=1 Tax=Stylosanthes scabra TaxID=79078 RepID=A0ABU6VTU0_9FABA|nr:hypothetical protein [Stylosanthes scabra]